MELFNNTTKLSLPEIAKEFSPLWWNELSDYISNNKTSDSFDKLLYDLDNERTKKTIYPAEEDMFKIFKLLPFEKVKVVIVGQDPYYNGNADGLAFSCKQTLSPSLRQIFYAIYVDTKIKPKKDIQPFHLDYLVNQGVFLYNIILTVEKDKPLSHKGAGWESFSKEVFRSLNKKEKLVWLLWGKEAQKQEVWIKNKKHLILRAEHPTAAVRNDRIWTVNHFTETNKYLKENGKEEIKWFF